MTLGLNEFETLSLDNVLSLVKRTKLPICESTNMFIICLSLSAQLKMNDLVTSEQIESINRGDKPLGTGILRPSKFHVLLYTP